MAVDTSRERDGGQLKAVHCNAMATVYCVDTPTLALAIALGQSTEIT